MIEFMTVYFRRKWFLFGPKVVTSVRGNYMGSDRPNIGEKIEIACSDIHEKNWQFMK